MFLRTAILISVLILTGACADVKVGVEAPASAATAPATSSPRVTFKDVPDVPTIPTVNAPPLVLEPGDYHGNATVLETGADRLRVRQIVHGDAVAKEVLLLVNKSTQVLDKNRQVVTFSDLKLKVGDTIYVQWLGKSYDPTANSYIAAAIVALNK